MSPPRQKLLTVPSLCSFARFFRCGPTRETASWNYFCAFVAERLVVCDTDTFGIKHVSRETYLRLLYSLTFLNPGWTQVQSGVSIVVLVVAVFSV